jgi:hypothetical protein
MLLNAGNSHQQNQYILEEFGGKKKKKKKHAGAVGSLFFKFVMWLKTSNHPHEDLAKFGYRYENIL